MFYNFAKYSLIEGPFKSNLCAVWISLSIIASAIVSFPKYACQSFIGSCAVIIIEPLKVLSSIISNKSFISSGFSGVTPKSSNNKSLNFEIFANVFVYVPSILETCSKIVSIEI